MPALLVKFRHGTQFGEHDVDTVLVNGSQTGIRYAQAHPAVLALDPEAAILQIRQERPFVLWLPWKTLFPAIGPLAVHWKNTPRILGSICFRKKARNF